MHDVTDLARQLTDIEPNSLLARIKALHLAKIAYAGATAKETARSVYDAQALELMDIHAEHDPWYQEHRESGLVRAVQSTLARQPAWKRMLPTPVDRTYNKELEHMAPTLGHYGLLGDSTPFWNPTMTILYSAASGAGIATIFRSIVNQGFGSSTGFVVGMTTLGAVAGLAYGRVFFSEDTEKRNELVENAQYLDQAFKNLKTNRTAAA